MGKPSEHTCSKGQGDRFREGDLGRLRRVADKSIQKPIMKSKHLKPTTGDASVTADTFADETANISSEKSASSSHGTAPTSLPAGRSGMKSASVSKSESCPVKPHNVFVDYAEAQIQVNQDMDAQIQSKDAYIRSQDAHIRNQEAQIDNHESQIQSLKAQIKSQDSTITKLKARLAAVNHISKITDADHTSETTDADLRNEKTKATGNHSNEEAKATPQREDKMDTDESGVHPARVKCRYGLTCRNTSCRFEHFDY